MGRSNNNSDSNKPPHQTFTEKTDLTTLAATPHESSEGPQAKRMRAEMRRKILAVLERPPRTTTSRKSRASSSHHQGKSRHTHQENVTMAKHLEVELFRIAATWEQYQDESTLEARLNHLAAMCSRRRTAWQQPARDRRLRCQMLELIRKLIIQRLSPDASRDYVEHRVPLLAQHVEQALYRQASTHHEYADKTTLMKRMNKLAMQQK